MDLVNLALAETNDLPIRHEGEVHNGKVRSVYWLNGDDSKRIGEQYEVNSQLGIMIISDRISAYDCLWQSGGGMKGIPGKGASLNAISKYWFNRFEKEGLANNHILDSPHPLVWLVERAEPIMVEAIGRKYITGSMWRAYKKGERDFCGIELPDGLQKDQRLDSLLITPSTKGIMKGIPGIPEEDDTNITRQQIINNYERFGFKSVEDIDQYEKLLLEGYSLIDKELNSKGEIFVDTKFEFGYVNRNGKSEMVYIDEVGTPDSSRYWDKKLYSQGITKENSKEFFREKLLNGVPDRDVLTNKQRMDERKKLAEEYRVSDEDFMETSELYMGLAEKITGTKVQKIENAREEIIEALSGYWVIK